MCESSEKINNIKIEEFDLKKLQHNLDILIANRNIQLNELDYKNKEVKRAFNRFKMCVDAVYDSKYFNQVWKLVDNSRKRLSNLTVEPNTIGAYLFGCMLNDYGDVKDKSQSVLCINSISNNRTYNYKNFIYYLNGNDELTSLLTPNKKSKSVDVLIYVDENFNIRKIDSDLKDFGIKSFFLYKTRRNKHVLINEFSSLNELPTTGPSGCVINNGGVSTGATGSTRGLDISISTSTLFWLAVIIILIVLIVIGIGWWKSYKSK